LRKLPQEAIFHVRDNTKGYHMRKLLLAISGAAIMIAGVGRDVGAVGDAVSKTAEEAK